MNLQILAFLAGLSVRHWISGTKSGSILRDAAVFVSLSFGSHEKAGQLIGLVAQLVRARA
jgi:hypothetical protein